MKPNEKKSEEVVEEVKSIVGGGEEENEERRKRRGGRNERIDEDINIRIHNTRIELLTFLVNSIDGGRREGESENSHVRDNLNQRQNIVFISS